MSTNDYVSPIRTVVNSNLCNITPPCAERRKSLLLGRYVIVDYGAYYGTFHELNVRIKIKNKNHICSQRELGPPNGRSGETGVDLF